VLVAAAICLASVLAACGAAPTAPGQAAGSSVPAASPSEPAATATATAAAIATEYPESPPRPLHPTIDGSCDNAYPCLGLLTAGTTYTEKVFSPQIQFMVPTAGWENLSEERGVFGLSSTTAPGDLIVFFRYPDAVDANGQTVDGVSGSVADLAAWLQGNDQLDVTTPAPATVGGFDGVVMDIRVAATAPTTVPHGDCPTRVCVPILAGHHAGATWDMSSAGTETQRLYLLDAGDGLLAIFVDSLDGTTFDALTSAADTILGTVRFN